MWPSDPQITFFLCLVLLAVAFAIVAHAMQTLTRNASERAREEGLRQDSEDRRRQDYLLASQKQAHDLALAEAKMKHEQARETRRDNWDAQRNERGLDLYVRWEDALAELKVVSEELTERAESILTKMEQIIALDEEESAKIEAAVESLIRDQLKSDQPFVAKLDPENPEDREFLSALFNKMREHGWDEAPTLDQVEKVTVTRVPDEQDNVIVMAGPEEATPSTTEPVSSTAE